MFLFLFVPIHPTLLSLAETSFVFTAHWIRQIEEGEIFLPKNYVENTVGGVG
jgi:hypothetical protein